MATDGASARNEVGKLSRGVFVGGYEVLCPIGSGGMADVYLARRSGPLRFERLVALKVLRAQHPQPDEARHAILDEAAIAASLHHANIISVIDAGDTELGPFVVMDYVDGPNLGQLLARAARRGQRLPRGVALRIALDVLAALAAVHEAQRPDGARLAIVHRDVSPTNVIVGRDGVARLTDFGIAWSAERMVTTSPGIVKGKLAYAAPEQLRAEAVDARTDLFAVGVMLWETLSMQRMTVRRAPSRERGHTLASSIVPLALIDPVLAPLDAVIATALSAEPDDRFASAREMSAAIEHAARDVCSIASQRSVSTAVEVLGHEWTRERDALVREAVSGRADVARSGRFARPPELAELAAERRRGSSLVVSAPAANEPPRRELVRVLWAWLRALWGSPQPLVGPPRAAQPADTKPLRAEDGRRGPVAS